MKYELEDQEHNTALLRLWILRLLKGHSVRRRFVQLSGFHDDDVARFLGLNDWTDIKPEEFDRYAMFQSLDSKLHELETSNPKPPSPCFENCAVIGGHIGLDPVGCQFLMALILLNQEPVFEDVLRMGTVVRRREWMIVVAQMLNTPRTVIERLCAPNSKLVTSGLAKWSSRHRLGYSFEPCNEELAEKIANEPCSVGGLLSTIVNPVPGPTLRYGDYPHVKDTLAESFEYVD